MQALNPVINRKRIPWWIVDQYDMDLHWSGRANRDVTIGKYNYGGLFLRMPWRRGIKGAVINSDGR